MINMLHMMCCWIKRNIQNYLFFLPMIICNIVSEEMVKLMFIANIFNRYWIMRIMFIISDIKCRNMYDLLVIHLCNRAILIPTSMMLFYTHLLIVLVIINFLNMYLFSIFLILMYLNSMKLTLLLIIHILISINFYALFNSHDQ